MEKILNLPGIQDQFRSQWQRLPGEQIFDIVFFAVVISTLLQGTTVEALARRLGLTTNEPALPRPLADSGTIRRLGAEVLEYPVTAADAIAGLRVRDLRLPREAVVNVIVRGTEAIPPRGATVIRPGDELHVLVRDTARREVEDLTRRWRSGPIGPGTTQLMRMPCGAHSTARFFVTASTPAFAAEA